MFYWKDTFLCENILLVRKWNLYSVCIHEINNALLIIIKINYNLRPYREYNQTLTSRETEVLRSHMYWSPVLRPMNILIHADLHE